MKLEDIKKQILRALRPLYFALSSEDRAKFLDMCEHYLLDETSSSLYKRAYENSSYVSFDGELEKRCLKVRYLEYAGSGNYMVTHDGYVKACEILKISQ